MTGIVLQLNTDVYQATGPKKHIDSSSFNANLYLM